MNGKTKAETSGEKEREEITVNGKTKTEGNWNFIEMLQLIFITLRLCGVIDWNWIWVLCPLWGSLSLVLILAGIGFVMGSKKGKGALPYE